MELRKLFKILLKVKSKASSTLLAWQQQHSLVALKILILNIIVTQTTLCVNLVYNLNIQPTYTHELEEKNSADKS